MEVGDHCLMRQLDLVPLPKIHVNTICKAYLPAEALNLINDEYVDIGSGVW